MNYIIAIGTFQALAATVLLWRNKLRSKDDGLLILLLACIAAHLAIKFYIYTTITDAQVRLQMNTFIGVCYGPLLYLYAIKKKNSAFVPIHKWYLFLPFLVSAIGYLIVASVLTVSRESGYQLLDIYNNSTTYLFLAVNAVLPFLAIQAAKQLPEGKEKLLIKEIGYCLLGLSSVAIISKILIAPGNAQFNLLFRSAAYAILALICLIIMRFKYVGVLNAAQAEPVSILQVDEIAKAATHFAVDEDPATIAASEGEIPPRDAPPAIARKLQLTPEEHERLWLKMEQYLEQTRIFTDSELNLDKLAHALQVNKYHLSETLNSYANRSFYQYLSEHRIQFILDKMQQYTKKNLPVNVLSLAYESGFKAKSSFNQHFKKLTGLTPTEYLKFLAKEKTATVA